MKTGRDYKDVERLQYEIAPHSSYYTAIIGADRRHILPLVAPPCILQARSAGIFSKCPQNKMAYEMIMVYHLHMPFFIVIFPCILT